MPCFQGFKSFGPCKILNYCLPFKKDRDESVLFLKENPMRNYLFAILSLFLASGVAYAKKDCTDQPKEKWMSEADLKKKVEAEGLKIRKFKQPGTCYEIYGENKEGKKVEIYFNPVDGSIVKEK